MLNVCLVREGLIMGIVWNYVLLSCECRSPSKTASSFHPIIHLFICTRKKFQGPLEVFSSNLIPGRFTNMWWHLPHWVEIGWKWLTLYTDIYIYVAAKVRVSEVRQSYSCEETDSLKQCSESEFCTVLAGCAEQAARWRAWDSSVVPSSVCW
jgi:hypothetical protein